MRKYFALIRLSDNKVIYIADEKYDAEMMKENLVGWELGEFRTETITNNPSIVDEVKSQYEIKELSLNNEKVIKYLHSCILDKFKDIEDGAEKPLPPKTLYEVCKLLKILE